MTLEEKEWLDAMENKEFLLIAKDMYAKEWQIIKKRWDSKIGSVCFDLIEEVDGMIRGVSGTEYLVTPDVAKTKADTQFLSRLTLSDKVEAIAKLYPDNQFAQKQAKPGAARLGQMTMADWPFL